MTQLPMNYGDRTTGREDWLAELEWCQRAVAAVGHKNAAAELDVSPSTLTDALKERESDGRIKAMKGEWVAILLRMVSYGLRQEYLTLKCAALGFEPPVPRATLTPEEEARLYREYILSLPMGREQLALARGGRP